MYTVVRMHNVCRVPGMKVKLPSYIKGDPHKGGHKSKYKLNNYSPIALRDTVGKICAILNERLRGWIKRKIIMCEKQNYFRKDRRAEDNIYVMSGLIGKINKDNERIYTE